MKTKTQYFIDVDNWEDVEINYDCVWSFYGEYAEEELKRMLAEA